MKDPVLETLLLPISNGTLPLADKARVLFLRARMGSELKELSGSDLTCVQSFAPDRDKLENAGHQVIADVTDAEGAAGYDFVLLLPTRQKQEARALLAQAIQHVRDGGVVLSCASNTEGAKAHESDMKQLAGLSGSLSKNKCRVFWATVDKSALDDNKVSEWAALDAERPVLDGAYVSRPGIFAWDRIDTASALLAQTLPDTLAGRGADLGAGFGFLTRHVLENCPKVAGMDLYEAEKRALDLARQNLNGFSSTKTLNGIWSDVTRGIESPYDFIVSNPPFHQGGKADRTDVGQGFIRSASRGLRSGGTLYLVANRHMPYEDTLKECFGSFDMLADEGGYKVLKAIKRKVV